MDNLVKNAISGVAGAVITAIPLYVFFESRVEKRVTYEVKVAGLEKNLETLEKQLDKHEDTTRGSIWTIEQDLKRLDKEVALRHSTP